MRARGRTCGRTPVRTDARARGRTRPCARTGAGAPPVSFVINTLPWANLTRGGQAVGNTPYEAELPEGPELVWLDGQLGPTQIYRMRLALHEMP